MQCVKKCFNTDCKRLTYFQCRYTEQQIAVLNKVVRIKGKIKTFKFSTAFLKACRSHRIALKYIIANIEQSKIRHSLVVERAFINDEIKKQIKQLKKLHIFYRSLLRVACQFLSFFDKIKFYRYFALIEKTSMKIYNKNESLLATLKKKRFKNMLCSTKKHILNLLNHVLSDVKSFVLSHGLNFCLPPKSICKEVFAEFESL